MESSSMNFNKSLNSIFDEIRDIYKKVDNSILSSTTKEYQESVTKGIKLSQILWNRIQELDIFSHNENVDDMSTESLKYIIVPGMVGFFLYKLITSNRIEILIEVKKYYSIFMELVNDYGLKQSKNTDVLGSRDDKIKQFRENKVLSEKLNYLEKNINGGHIDDEMKREYFMILIKHWISKVENDFKIIDDEIFILENRNSVEISKDELKPPNLKSFVITKDMIKNTVFGMGYKNLPTYSLEDFYVMQVEQGQVPYPEENQLSKPRGGVNRIVPDENLEDELLAKKNDFLEDICDENNRLKQINFDNFKDENRRGCGNTTNRG